MDTTNAVFYACFVALLWWVMYRRPTLLIEPQPFNENSAVYVSHWTAYPHVQTKDHIPLLEGFDQPRCSSTVQNWFRANAETCIPYMHLEPQMIRTVRVQPSAKSFGVYRALLPKDVVVPRAIEIFCILVRPRDVRADTSHVVWFARLDKWKQPVLQPDWTIAHNTAEDRTVRYEPDGSIVTSDFVPTRLRIQQKNQNTLLLSYG